MDTELLVDERVEDGRLLLSDLVRSGFDVTAAFWIKTGDEGLWFLYIASATVPRGKIGDAYGTVYVALSRVPGSSITLSDIKLVAPNHPAAAEAIAIRDRYPARIPTRYTFNGARLGESAVEEAYIYPRTGPGLSRTELLQTVTALMSRTGPLQPSAVKLRDGSTLRAIPVGIQTQQPGPGIMIELEEVSTGRRSPVAIDEIVDIQ